MEIHEDLIDLHLCNDRILVWTADDVKQIREMHHIVGKLIGCLPRVPHQNSQLGIPLLLMPVEAAMLIEYGVARIVSVKVLPPTTEDVKSFIEHRVKSFAEQDHIAAQERESRKVDILKGNRTNFGKKKKQLRKEKARQRKMIINAGTYATFEESCETSTQIDCKKSDIEEGSRQTTEEKLESNIDGDGKEKGVSDFEESCTSKQDVSGIDCKRDIPEDIQSFEEVVAKKRKTALCDDGIRPRVETPIENSGDNINRIKGQIEVEKKDAHIIIERLEEKICQEEDEEDNNTTDKVETGTKDKNIKIAEQPDGTSRCLIQLPTCATKLNQTTAVKWKFPSSQKEWLRFKVYKELWEQGYYVTTGGKFGGDFLIYPGDPLLFHSSFIAVCCHHTQSFSALDLVQFGRLASNVKKTVVLCSLDAEDNLVFTSVQWTGIS